MSLLATSGSKCPKHLFSNLEEISSIVDSAYLVALFLDYDGTLSPIPRRGIRLERALSSAARRAIHELLKHQKVKIFIISGRSIESLRRLIDIDNLYYIGVHGHIIRGPDIEYTHSALTGLASIMRDIRDRVLEIASKRDGIFVEDKCVALSIHLRGVNRERSRDLVSEILRICREYYGVKIVRGKGIVEVLPNTGWDKGRAVEYLLALLSKKTGLGINKITPIYFGDDRSDEEGFKLLRGRGIGVRVGYRCRTKAQYYVNDPAEVIRFLNMLKHMLPQQLT